MHDLVVRGASIVDGTGAAAVIGDVAVDGGVITEVGVVSEQGREEIDAGGLVVSPGFIDGHTHMDAQLFWEEHGASSCWSGVTTAVIGNCGFTLAPSRDGRRDLALRSLERAEDIPRAALEGGLSWGFETFPEYLDAVDQRPMGINYAAQIGHSALRTWVMGDRAYEQAADDDDLKAMDAQLRDALAAGAVGFTTSVSPNHITADEQPVASRLADWRELRAMCETAGESPGVMLGIALGRPDDVGVIAEMERRLEELAVDCGVVPTFGVTSSHATDDSDWRGRLALIDRARAAGGRMVGLTHPRGVSVHLSFATQLPFDKLDGWREFRQLSLAEQEARLRDPESRGRLEESAGQTAPGTVSGGEARPPEYDRMEVLIDPVGSNPTVAEIASQRGVSPITAFIDLALESGLTQFFTQPLGNNDESVLLEIMKHPGTVMTFSDAGAHVGQISDACLQTYFLARWVRQLEAFPLEEAVRMITAVPAGAWGFADRGYISPGYVADLNIFDPATIGPLKPRVMRDLPGGGMRLEARSGGIEATIVAGQVTIRDGVPTEARPGRLLRRGARAA